MSIQSDVIIKILLAVLLGGLIGGEREFRDKTAGFRTMIMICLGATLFTILSTYLAGGNSSSGVVAGIVTGIGFLGAGAILRDGNHIIGLTTASCIWQVAAVGMAVGTGQYALAVAVTLTVLIVLWIFPILETRIDDLRHTRTYHVVCHNDLQSCQQLESSFSQHGLKLLNSKRTKSGDQMMFIWKTNGSRAAHEGLVDALMQDADVLELTY